jgi:sulfur carrier protein ThiS
MMPMIRIRIPQKNKEMEIPGPRLVMDILAETGHRPATVIVTQGRKLLTKDHRVEDGETIDVVSVVSGG